MKKKMITLLAGLMLTLSAGSAFAAFENFDLIRVVYQKSGGTVEIGTDLGNVSSLLGTTNNTVGDLITDTTLANSYVTYFAVNQGTKELWMTGGADAPKTGSLKSGTVTSVSNAIWGYYNTLGGTAGATQVVGDTTNANSFKVKTAGNGSFNTVITVGFADTEAALADLASGAITQNLYYFANYGSSAFGVLAGTITTTTGGATVINASSTPEVPIPAAAWLLGSGLMGLVGIRRKQRG